MQLLFRTWNHFIPLVIVTNKTLKRGDIVKVRGEKYYVNCEPGTITPSGKRCKFYYCTGAHSTSTVTNTTL